MNVLVLSAKQGLQGPCFISQVLLDVLTVFAKKVALFRPISAQPGCPTSPSGHFVNFRILSQGSIWACLEFENMLSSIQWLFL